MPSPKNTPEMIIGKLREIDTIVREEPKPWAQEGEVVTYRRRKPDQSELPSARDLHDVYDHIRMLDANTYPRSFIDHGKFRLTFRDAQVEVDGKSIRELVQ